MLDLALILACLGSGMMTGLFVAFSTFMMKALDSLGTAGAIRAMQAINQYIVRPSFLVVFIGTAVLLIASSCLSFLTPGFAWIISATVVYVLACIISTIAFNVPLNDRLGSCDPADAASHIFWNHYLLVWARWNHVRSVACVTTTVLLAVALLVR